MKKTFSILLAVLIIASSVHLSIATHFCGGSFEALKISISEKKADCGMESSVPACEKGIRFGHNCCTDKLASYLINENYSPVSFYLEKSNQVLLTVVFGAIASIPSNPTIQNLQIAYSPPGELIPSEVELASICIFRI